MTDGRDAVYLRHMTEAADKILAYTEGYDRPRFLSTPIVQDAVIRQLEIIGEAAQHVSTELESENPHIR